MEKILSLKYFGKSKISLAKALMFFYIVIASNYIKDLYSGQLKDFLKNNRLAQHSLGILTMFMIMVDVGGVKDMFPALTYSIIGYIWFIFTTKLDLRWSLSIWGLMILGMFYENYINRKEDESNSDQALDETDKIDIENNNNWIKSMIVLSIVLITIIGAYQYLTKKRVQYGGGFKMDKFLLNGRNKKLA